MYWHNTLWKIATVSNTSYKVIYGDTKVPQRSDPVTDIGVGTDVAGGFSFLGLSVEEWNELTPAQQKALTNATPDQQKKLTELLSTMPRRNWTDKLGSMIGDVISAPVKAALAIPEFLAMLANKSTWVRVGEGVLGVVCLCYGLVLIAKDLGASVPSVGALTKVMVKKGAA